MLFGDLNFSIESGQVLQVEGHNGSGKTTLLRTLCGLALPSNGEVRWCGQNIRKAQTDYFAELSYVGHYAGVKDELTALENLAMARAMSTSREGVGAEDALQRLGLPVECEDVPCRNLSAGQKRRVALARLLVTDTRLWVMDEPFTALDVAGRRTVEEMLSEHSGRGGIAVITTHHAVSLDSGLVKHLRLSA